MIVGTKAEFERLADFILRDYLGNAHAGYHPLDIQAFAKDYLKLDISYFAFDCSMTRKPVSETSRLLTSADTI